MSERIVPNDGHEINVGGQTILIAPGFDTLMYYQPLDAHWIRYYDGEDRDMKMVILKEKAARIILEQTHLPYCIRETITETEHNNLVETLGKWVVDEAFGGFEEPEET